VAVLTALSRRFLFPGSVEFLLLGLLVGVAGLYARQRVAKVARAWLTCLTVGYLVISTPAGADLLVWGLAHGFSPVVTRQDTQGATAIVVLAADSNTLAAGGREIEQISQVGALRVFEAARLHDLLPHALIFTSGGPSSFGSRERPLAALLGEQLVLLGVPPDRIVIEARSGNTYQHAERLDPLLRQHGVHRFLLVTSPTHIRRATRTFEARGLQPVPAPGQMRSSDETGDWWPSLQHLRVSQQAIYDYLGLAYYWGRGWI
jgi:uncharacterized SAM-binding protein YcdF (DUF218 family)